MITPTVYFQSIIHIQFNSLLLDCKLYSICFRCTRYRGRNTSLFSQTLNSNDAMRYLFLSPSFKQIAAICRWLMSTATSLRLKRSAIPFDIIAMVFQFFFTTSFHEFVSWNFLGFKHGYLIYVCTPVECHSICQIIELEQSEIESNAVRSNMPILLDFHTFHFVLIVTATFRFRSKIDGLGGRSIWFSSSLWIPFCSFNNACSKDRIWANNCWRSSNSSFLAFVSAGNTTQI